MMTEVKRVPMAGWQAVVLAVIFLLVMIFLPPLISILIVLGSSLWASFDAAKIETKKYAGGSGPALVFIGGILLWIAVFPWYLYFRSKILAGVADIAKTDNRPDELVREDG